VEGVRPVRDVTERHRSRPRRVLHYSFSETHILTGTAATFCSIAAREQCYIFESYSLWRSLYEQARRSGATAYFAEDVTHLLAGTRTPAYYKFVDTKKDENKTDL